jgi:RNA-directed DNA polymerase
LGWPDRSRGPGSRSQGSSRGSHAPPGRTRRSSTGRRLAGAWSKQKGRYPKWRAPKLEACSPSRETSTGERGVRKRTRLVRGRAGGKGRCKSYLACGLSYFVVLHSDKDKIDQATAVLTAQLADMGLILSPSKTRITHTLTPHQENVGFDFLGFTIRQFPVGKTHTGKSTNGQPLGFKTIIKPSKESAKQHLAQTKRRLRQLRSRPQWQVIKELNPVIRGWTNYYKTVISTKVFSGCDNVLNAQLRRWSRVRHPNKGSQWIRKKYWKAEENRHWVFATPEGAKLRLHSDTHIQRHVKVKGEASPYDGHLLYWSQRLKTHPLLTGTLAKALQRQGGRCGWCGLLFTDEDIIEIDHRDRNRNNNVSTNLFALHRHCHDERHAKDAEDRYQSQ